MRRRSRWELGEGQAGCIFGLLVFLAAIFVAYKMIPIKVKAAELRQTVVDEAKSAGNHNNARILKEILAEAEEQKLPVAKENVRVVRAKGEIEVTVEYDVPVEFPGYTYQWHFRHHVKNPIF
jgi:hypothetical protein